MEMIGSPPPNSPELLEGAIQELPVSGHTAGEVAREAAAAGMQPAMQVVQPDFSTGPAPWRDPAFIRWEHGMRDDPPPAVPQAGHGFLAHLKGLMEGLGAGLATGHPLAGAIMGAGGAVKPQLGANAWYNNVTLPRWQGQQEQALDRAAKRLAMAKSIGELTGIDVFTGEPTYAAQQAKAKAELTDQIDDAVAAHRKELEEIARQREKDMLEVARGNLDVRKAQEMEKERVNKVTEDLRQQILKIQQQNADANTLRANRADQPRITTTTKIRGANRDHAKWEKERDDALGKNPGAAVKQLIKRKVLRKEPSPLIQTGTRTIRRVGAGASTKAKSAQQQNTITPQQYDLQVKKYITDLSKSPAEAKTMVNDWMQKNGYKVSGQ
jgi:hypothetical protein